MLRALAGLGALGGAARAQLCADDPGFEDETGHPCSLWHNPGFDCGSATSDHYYSAAGQAALLAACPLACDSCSTAVDCVGEWGRCGESCADRVFSVRVAARAGGRPCEAAHGATAACS
eukprot:COSAG04_NODE_12509_length_649_cov_1.150909_1_plen_118_part_01